MHITALDDAAWAAPWRRVRVGEKVALGLALVVTALVTPAWPGSVLVGAAALVLLLGPAKIPARVVAMGLTPPLAFIVIGAASVAVRVGEPAADAWFRLGPLSADPRSAALAASVFGHAVAGTLAIFVIALTTPMVDLLTWLRRLGVPGPLVEVASLIYRVLWLLLESAVNIHNAQVARLADAPGGGWAGYRRRLGHAATAMGAVLVRSWDRAARLSAGLEARGIDGDLLVLPARRPANPRFMVGAAALLASIWAVVAIALVVGAA